MATGVRASVSPGLLLEYFNDQPKDHIGPLLGLTNEPWVNGTALTEATGHRTPPGFQKPMVITVSLLGKCNQ